MSLATIKGIVFDKDGTLLDFHATWVPRAKAAVMAIAKGDGRYSKVLATLAKTDVLIIDDWGLAKLTTENRRDLLEILEDRHGSRSTLATSQLPVENWHDMIGDPTLADAILDRLVHNAYKIGLKGGSMRKRRAKLTSPIHAE